MSKDRRFGLTHRDLAPEASCTIKIEDETRTFTDFVAVGVDDEGNPTIITYTDLPTLYNAAETLMEMYKQMMAEAAPEVRAEVEAELVIERSLLGEWEEEE